MVICQPFRIPYLFLLLSSYNPKIGCCHFHYKQSVFIYITSILPYTTFIILIEYYKNESRGVRPLYFEEFTVGHIFICEPILITAEEIHQFAMKYDPAPIHINPEYAENESIFNGIISSGLPHALVLCGDNEYGWKYLAMSL